MMSEAGIEGNYKNHSLRKSTYPRLFRKWVEAEHIKEQTGHKSDAVTSYKKSNTAQKKGVSAMLSVLPKEMDDIRSSQDRMIAKEEAFKKKKLTGHPPPY